ncbi:hypothetical protein [Erythrobacter alti]|uniref:hypothetical protein n=1 Tax=Erythrobacter alti TaxID=1896145 RepID=UPI0030F4A373
MGRKFIAIAIGALTLSLLAVPAVAQGKGLNCMAGQYSTDQREELAELGRIMSTGGADINEPAFDRISSIAMSAIETCTARLDWNPEQSIYATLYELGRVNEAAYRSSGNLSSSELRMLDDALAAGNRDRLWGVIEAGVMSGMGGEEVSVSQGDAMVMGAFLMGAGLDVDDESQMVAEKVGLLLGFMGLQRIGQREFTNLR